MPAKKKSSKTTENSTPMSYVHIDDYLGRRADLTEIVKQGFRLFMRGRTYQHNHEDFEKALHEFLNREI